MLAFSSTTFMGVLVAGMVLAALGSNPLFLPGALLIKGASLLVNALIQSLWVTGAATLVVGAPLAIQNILKVKKEKQFDQIQDIKFEHVTQLIEVACMSTVAFQNYASWANSDTHTGNADPADNSGSRRCEPI